MPTPSHDTPTDVTIITEKALSTVINGCTEYTFYINGQEYRELPLDANVREPDTKKSKPYKDMMKTLSKEPEKFFENNLGISVIANKVTEKGNNKFILHFNSGTGILNGGHTQRAILDSASNENIANAIIRITVRVKDYSTKRIAEIASAQNSCTAVKPYSLAEKKGLFADIKKQLDPNIEKHIIWYEGKEVPGGVGMEAHDLIAILNLFNIDMYLSNYSSSEEEPITSASGKAGAFKKWENEDNLQSFKRIYPLLNDILPFYEYVQKNCTEGTGLTKLDIINSTKGKKKSLIFLEGEKCEYDVPKQMILPLLAAFRANVFFDQANGKIGWFQDNEELFDKNKKELIAKLSKTFVYYKRDVNRVGKDATLWENLYRKLKDAIDTSKPYRTYDIPK